MTVLPVITMQFHHPPLYASALEQAIDRNAPLAGPETFLAEAIALISQPHSCCHLRTENLPPRVSNGLVADVSVTHSQHSGCLLVVKQESKSLSHKILLGTFAASDVIRLIATGKGEGKQSTNLLPIRDVMSPASITFTESEDEHDIFAALSLFRQHRLRYLPVVDKSGRLTGVLTRESIRQVLQPSNILKLRRVTELMIAPITAPANTSLLELAHLMAEYQTSCVVITQNKQVKVEKTKTDYISVCHHTFQQPVGIITEQDIVQALFLELNLETTVAGVIMNTPLFFLNPTDSLWVAHKEMQQRQIQRIVVCGTQGELLGIITQTSLLQVLDPTEMYRAVKQLQQSVYQLQAEKLELLQSRNAKLEEQVRERTAKLHEQAQRDRLLTKIALRIHQSLNLDQILNATVAEVRQVLQADRVEISRLESAGGVVVAESVALGWPSVLGNQIPEAILQEYQQVFERKIYACSNIDEVENISFELFSRFREAQIFGYIIVPILQDGQLWGMMGVHQCSAPREWQQSEVELLLQLATQVAIAIQQAQLYQQVQNLNADLEQQVQERTAQLQQKVQELQQLNILKDDFLSTVSHELRTPLANMKLAIHMLRVAPTAERRKIYLNILEAECSRETDLINALLDLQRLEASAYPISLESVNLSVWLPSIVDPFQARTHNRQQVFQVEYVPNLPTIRSSRATLGRILAELLNNACKYTPNGAEIAFKVDFFEKESYLENGEENGTTCEYGCDDFVENIAAFADYKVQFVIANQVEIPAEELPRIFDKFYRVPNADPWKQGGTGLGLALVQKLVEQLKGKIQVQSGAGWTTFTVEIPG